MGTVIQFPRQQAPRGSLGEDPIRRSCLPPMLALTPWWPVVLGLQFWSEVLAARAAALERSQKGDVAPAKVVPMAAFKARRVS